MQSINLMLNHFGQASRCRDDHRTAQRHSFQHRSPKWFSLRAQDNRIGRQFDTQNVFLEPQPGGSGVELSIPKLRQALIVVVLLSALLLTNKNEVNPRKLLAGLRDCPNSPW